MSQDGTSNRGWAIATGCLAVAAISCVPLYIVLQIVGGFLSEAEQAYWNAHRTPLRYELPADFSGKGEIDFNQPDGTRVVHEGDTFVFQIPPSGRLRLQDGYNLTSGYVHLQVFLGSRRLAHRNPDGSDEDVSYRKPVGVGFYDRMNDDANPANHYDDANRQAFFVGTQEEFEDGVRSGKIKPWE